jgi:hypothetical protein
MYVLQYVYILHTHSRTHAHTHICIYMSQAQHISQTLHAISHTLRGILARQGEAAADERSAHESAGESGDSDGAGSAGGGERGGGKRLSQLLAAKEKLKSTGLAAQNHQGMWTVAKKVPSCGRNRSCTTSYHITGLSVSEKSREAQGVR